MKRYIAIGVVAVIAALVMGVTMLIPSDNAPGVTAIVFADMDSVADAFPNESFAYWSIEPGIVVAPKNEARIEVSHLPHENFAYWSIEPGTAVAGQDTMAVDFEEPFPNEPPL